MDKILNWGWKVKSLVGGSKNTYLLNTDEYHIIEGRSTIAVMGQEWAGGNAEANAHLIAQSPRLYEWVRDFGLNVAVNYIEIDGELKPSYLIDEDYMEQRKEILAKVEKC